MLTVLPEYCTWKAQKLRFQLGLYLISAAASLGALVRIAEFLILDKNLSQNLVFQSATLQKDFLKTSTSTCQKSGWADLKKLEFLSSESHLMLFGFHCLESSCLSSQAGGEKQKFFLVAEVRESFSNLADNRKTFFNINFEIYVFRYIHNRWWDKLHLCVKRGRINWWYKRAASSSVSVASYDTIAMWNRPSQHQDDPFSWLVCLRMIWCCKPVYFWMSADRASKLLIRRA